MRGLPTLPPSLPPAYFTDDVLSHLFLTTTFVSSSLNVHLLPNPSHLEAVSPVGVGFARALQVPFQELEAKVKGEEFEIGKKVLSLQIHGDAAFGGQGVVAESLNLASLCVGRPFVRSTLVDDCSTCAQASLHGRRVNPDRAQQPAGLFDTSFVGTVVVLRD